MSPPINIDGTNENYSSVTIDGQTVEQITIDGQDVLSKIPDSGLEHHYVASEFSLNDGDSVGTWSDKVGSEDLSVIGGPIYKTSQIGGEDVVSYDGSDDGHVTQFATTLTQPNQIYIVCRLDSGTDNYMFDGFSDNTHIFQRDNSNDFRINAGNPINAGDSDTNKHIHNGLFNGGSSNYRLDGTDNTGDVGTSDLDGLRVAQRETSSRKFAPVDVAEILVYGSEQSTSDRDDTETYLSDKYGITI